MEIDDYFVQEKSVQSEDYKEWLAKHNQLDTLKRAARNGDATAIAKLALEGPRMRAEVDALQERARVTIRSSVSE